MMIQLKNKLLILLVLVTFSSQAQFLKKRNIEKSSDPWHKVLLPLDFWVENENRTSNIRVLSFTGSDTIEAPYVIRTNPTTYEVVDFSFTKLNQSYKDGRGYVTYKLFDRLVEYNYIKLDVSQNEFDLYLNLEGSVDGREWFSFSRNQRITALNYGAINYRFTEVKFPMVNYPFIRISYSSRSTYSISIDAKIEKRIKKTGDYDKENIDFVQEKENKTTVLTKRFQTKKRISELTLEVDDTVGYHRFMQVDVLTDSVQNKKGVWEYFYANVYSGMLSSFTENKIKFDEIFSNELRITIHNDDNIPLTVNHGIIASLQQFLVVRFPSQDQFSLYYAAPDLNAPVYDIAQFVPDINKLQNLKISNSEDVKFIEKKDVEAEIPSYWTWVSIGVMLLLMGFFAIKMIKAEKNEE